MNLPPNDQRNFVHKRLIRAATGFVTSGFNPLSAASGFIAAPRMPTSGGGSTALVAQRLAEKAIAQRRLQEKAIAQRRLGEKAIARQRLIEKGLDPGPAPGRRPGVISIGQKERGRLAKFGVPDFIDDIIGGGGPGDCGFGRVWDEVRGKCVFGLGDQAGRDDTPIGDVVMGRYGAGEVPGNMVVNRAICRPGMVVGDDGICYNKSQIKNSEREWPRGRRPLLTGGDMKAISTAAKAGRRLTGATKRLQKIGLMKKPAARRISAAAAHHSK